MAPKTRHTRKSLKSLEPTASVVDTAAPAAPVDKYESDGTVAEYQCAYYMFMYIFTALSAASWWWNSTNIQEECVTAMLVFLVHTLVKLVDDIADEGARFFPGDNVLLTVCLWVGTGVINWRSPIMCAVHIAMTVGVMLANKLDTVSFWGLGIVVFASVAVRAYMYGDVNWYFTLFLLPLYRLDEFLDRMGEAEKRSPAKLFLQGRWSADLALLLYSWFGCPSAGIMGVALGGYDVGIWISESFSVDR